MLLLLSARDRTKNTKFILPDWDDSFPFFHHEYTRHSITLDWHCEKETRRKKELWRTYLTKDVSNVIRFHRARVRYYNPKCPPFLSMHLTVFNLEKKKKQYQEIKLLFFYSTIFQFIFLQFLCSIQLTTLRYGKVILDFDLSILGWNHSMVNDRRNRKTTYLNYDVSRVQ